nr:hypothetical protein [Actinomycetota bacterium]
ALECSKAVQNFVVAAEQFLDDPEDPTGEATAQMGLYAHPGQYARGPDIDPGAELLPTPPPYRCADRVLRMRPSAC